VKFDAIAPGIYPELIYPPYKSTTHRGPQQPLLRLDAPVPVSEGLAAKSRILLPHDADLTKHGEGEPLGEKIVVTGRIVDEDGKPVRNSLLEVWQCNAAGRYATRRTSTTRRSIRTSPAGAR
jgi:protocatechuate 3,4-dioxygenase beta subunit